jgi:LCP family protein required for cell wall assembly
MKLMKNIKKNFPKDWLTRSILAAIILLSVVGAFLLSKTVSGYVARTTAFSLPGDPVLPETEQGETPGGVTKPETEQKPQIELPDPDPWDGTSRVNVLLLGLDLRDEEDFDEAPRSDTMILLSLDPLNNTAAAVAIPRDLWIPIPGFSYQKINVAYRFGELYNVPGGGPALASKTIESLLGIPIDFYAQVDFQAFVDFIDHIEGLRFTFEEPITLDRRGKWNTVTLDPGTYALPGEYVLAYARNRKSDGDDFSRSDRQMEVILKIRERILEFDMLPTLVMNAPAIYNDLSTGIRTNMSLNQVIQLAWKAREIPLENIQMVVIGPEYVTIEKSPDGLDILRPIPDKIRLLRDQVLGSGGVLGPVTDQDISSLAAEEGARITVLNGSYQNDLGEKTAQWFQEQGLNVLGTGYANPTATSRVTMQGPTPYALRWITDTFGMTPGQIRHDLLLDPEMDIILTLGDDWAYNNPIED